MAGRFGRAKHVTHGQFEHYPRTTVTVGLTGPPTLGSQRGRTLPESVLPGLRIRGAQPPDRVRTAGGSDQMNQDL